MDQIADLSDRFARVVHLDGNSADSREPLDAAGTTYRVVTGLDVEKQIPWLAAFYEDDLRVAIEDAIGQHIYTATNKKYGVNVNTLLGAGSRYEWHVDPCPISAVLFVTSHAASDGGALAVRAGDELKEVVPRAGLVAVFEGGRLEHAVLPLRSDVRRISVPMLYYHHRERQSFPDELDLYLYGTER